MRKEPTSLRFFAILNWMLQYMPPLADEETLRHQLATIGVQPGRDFAGSDAATHASLVAGMQAGLQEMVAFLGMVKSSGELFGGRKFLGHNYINRAVGAMVGILGNSAEEYLGIGYPSDADGRPFDGTYAYPSKRYVINSPMVDGLVKHADGGFTIYVQHASPGADREPNWLPVPAGKFTLTFRAYQPEQAIQDSSYQAPPVVRVTEG